MNWSKDDIERVKALAAQKMTASAIAVEFGRSRSSIIGLCHREGIPLLSRQRYFGASNVAKPKAARAAAAARSEGARKPRITLAAAPPAPEPVKPAPVPVENALAALAPPPPKKTASGKVPLLALRKYGQCRYPEWGHNDRPPIEERYFCGAKISETDIYCAEHAARCYDGKVSKAPKRPFMPGQTYV